MQFASARNTTRAVPPHYPFPELDVEGRLRIGLPLTCHHLIPAITKFQQHYPRIEMDLDFDNRKSQVKTEGLDAVLRTGDVLEDGLVGYRLGSFRLFIVGSPEYFDRNGMPERCADLEKHTCIQYRLPGSVATMRWPLEPEGDDRYPDMRYRMTCNSNDARMSFLVAGLGVSCMPEFAIDRLIRQRVLEVVLEPFTRHRFVYRLLWNQDATPTPANRAFISFMVNYYCVPTSSFEVSGQTWHLEGLGRP